MRVYNSDIAAIFDEMADRLEIEGANPFRIRAYRNAGRTVRDLPREITAMLDKQEDLTEFPGIGEDPAGKIKEIVDTGTTAALEEHRRAVPATLTELLRIPGIGPQRVKTLYDAGYGRFSRARCCGHERGTSGSSLTSRPARPETKGAKDESFSENVSHTLQPTDHSEGGARSWSMSQRGLRRGNRSTPTGAIAAEG